MEIIGIELLFMYYHHHPSTRHKLELQIQTGTAQSLMSLQEVRIHIRTPSVEKQSTITKFPHTNENFGIIKPAELLPSNGHNINRP
jgi:hypothetical protein